MTIVHRNAQFATRENVDEAMELQVRSPRLSVEFKRAEPAPFQRHVTIHGKAVTKDQVVILNTTSSISEFELELSSENGAASAWESAMNIRHDAGFVAEVKICVPKEVVEEISRLLNAHDAMSIEVDIKWRAVISTGDQMMFWFTEEPNRFGDTSLKGEVAALYLMSTEAQAGFMERGAA